MKKCIKLLLLLHLVFLSQPIVYATSMTAIFAPDDKVTKELITRMDAAKKSIHASVYLLTDKSIAQALINAKKRNVEVKIILDVISTDQKYGKADMLLEGNVDVFIFDPNKKLTKDFSSNRWSFNNPIMHHKFAIFDSTSVWTGSFNWTVSANSSNCENVMIINGNREICKLYEQSFKNLIDLRCTKYDPQAKNKDVSSLRQEILNILATSPDDGVLADKLLQMLQSIAI